MGRVRKGDTQGTIDDGNALIDCGAGQLAILTGLESHIVQHCRFGEGVFGDYISVVNTLPPPEKVQQLVRIGSQGGVGQAAEHFVVEVLVDPVNLTAGGLFNDAIRAAHMVVGGLVNYTEGHHCAASSRDWNCGASPPWTKKLFGSWPSGRAMVREFTPCSVSRQTSD